jgi:transposase
MKLTGIGPDHAGQLLTTAGSNPDRLHGEAAFAHLCGVATIPASSGKTNRHRLHRGGDRGANRALHPGVVVRMRYCCQRTRDYVTRRTSEGLSKPDIMLAEQSADWSIEDRQVTPHPIRQAPPWIVAQQQQESGGE